MDRGTGGSLPTSPSRGSAPPPPPPPPNQTIITPEMRIKILNGQRVGTSNRVIGGHSPNINNANPRYAVETIQRFPDGTARVRFVTQFPDGSVSRIKTSTIFPQNWSDTKIINSVTRVGNTQPIGVRAHDGAKIYRATIDGVQIEVIKIGNNVTSAYPTGGGATGLPAGFVPIH